MPPRRPALAASAIAVLCLAVATVPATASPSSLAFSTVKLATSSGISEPRVTVTDKDVRYIVTNAGASNDIGIGAETIYKSKDGLHWSKTKGQPSDQNEATTDVDIVSMRNG